MWRQEPRAEGRAVLLAVTMEACGRPAGAGRDEEVIFCGATRRPASPKPSCPDS